MSKTWFITGAARGLGAAIAMAALDEGHRVIATDRNIAQLKVTYADCGSSVATTRLDVTDPDQATICAKDALARFGSIDVLVNNAGYGQFGVFEENDIGDIERQFAVNVFGVFNVTRAVLPIMREQRRGHIFNMSAIGGFIGCPNSSLYSASKFAVEGFSESLAHEVAPFGINVTMIEPGFMRTNFLGSKSVRFGSGSINDYAESSEKARQFAENNHQKQTGDPVKLGRAVVRLASELRPPLRYVAGSDALALARNKLETLEREFDEWAKLSAAADGTFPPHPRLRASAV
jgi:NAD(P)-dependent dehydrogenase (short-subunit alcohol dehydrogenase family)